MLTLFLKYSFTVKYLKIICVPCSWQDWSSLHDVLQTLNHRVLKRGNITMLSDTFQESCAIIIYSFRNQKFETRTRILITFRYNSLIYKINMRSFMSFHNIQNIPSVLVLLLISKQKNMGRERLFSQSYGVTLVARGKAFCNF